MNSKSCFFIGHREANESLCTRLETYYPEGLEEPPRAFATVNANLLMVDSCDWLICYVHHSASNFGKLLGFAERREKKGIVEIESSYAYE